MQVVGAIDSMSITMSMTRELFSLQQGVFVMKVFRYWAKAGAPVKKYGQQFDVETFGWSNASVEDALAKAAERARATGASIENDDSTGYGYGDRPIREEIVLEFEHQGEVVGVVTRNVYGCLVVNSPCVFFADIDYPIQLDEDAIGLIDAIGGVTKFFKGLFGLGKKDDPYSTTGDESEQKPDDRMTPDEQIVSRVRSVVEANPGLGARLYRTKNGFRCLVTSHTFDPMSQETADLLADFDSDPLYMALCHAQECFRARLTPKPWRCGVKKPPTRFPFKDLNEEQRYRQWEENYQEKTAGYSTCAFIESFGTPTIDPAVKVVLDLHDQTACANEGPIA